MRELSFEEIDLVSGGKSSSDEFWNDVGAGALAGGFAGLYVGGGNPVGFLAGAAAGATLGAAYFVLSH